MMIFPPSCYYRKCIHFLGIYQKDGTEMSEVPSCLAFPKGIPKEIAYGGNKHIEPYPGDNGIQFEPKEK